MQGNIASLAVFSCAQKRENEPGYGTRLYTACHTHCMGERVGSTSMVHLPPDSQPPGRRVEVLGRAGALASLDPAEICGEM